MSLVRAGKGAFLRWTFASGIDRRVMESWWRAQRILILCWHKLSFDDEHLWNPYLCMSKETFERRLELIRQWKCNVLPLQEALSRLGAGTLPERTVVLTFDDGDSSFHLLAWPLLKRFGYPATLYWTTYYSTRPYAVFDPAVRYLLWKGRSATLNLGAVGVEAALGGEAERDLASRKIYELCRLQDWDAKEKEAFLEELSRALGIDYQDIKARRILHLIGEEDARQMIAEGLDIQLHTHRHRVSRVQSEFNTELSKNERIILAAGAERPIHFCYPSGAFLPEFAGWLRERGIQSATTCQPGLVSRGTDPFYLPRFVDTDTTTAAEFSGWLSGVASWLPVGTSSKRHVLPG